MRKNFERIIFAVSVCVLGGVLFIQGILYLKDLGFADETDPVTLSLTQNQSAAAAAELECAPAEPAPLDSLPGIELALAEANEGTELEAEATEDPALAGPRLTLPESGQGKILANPETARPALPLLPDLDSKLHQTPGPLMPPLNAEPLADSPKQGNEKSDALIRSIIKEHLPHASAEEHQIWFEELRGVPPKVANDMLAIRKLLQPKTALRMPTDQWEKLNPTLELAPPQPQVISSTNNRGSDQGGFIGFSSQADRDELLHRLRPTVDALRMSRDVIVNNIANAGTIGFKRLNVEFEALPYEYIETPASEKSDSAPPIAVGMGSQVLQTRLSQAPGELIKTGRQLDVAIEGQGFLQVTLEDKTLFTRAGRLMIDDKHRLCLRGSQQNFPLVPEILISESAHSVQIRENGTVVAILTGEETTGKEQQLGSLKLACFADASELFPRESCLFAATTRSGAPRVLTPGQQGAGLLISGTLEASNVSIAEELEALASIKQRVDALQTIYQLDTLKPIRADLGPPSDRIARPQGQRLPRGNRPIIK
ncbi:Flagellar basal-body rod protein FlgG [Gimesia panareensis]|uniref:Flagellar basal-body rod protein FlgG n=1 Tax=Gimesia panareensis TaxID=2527978 RepID=A0A517QEV6_9PLAN|nr:flagellar hook-basal body complex protein [Gimesia panareensis]QDT30172.1 Flagellar basal-body rod protein FlgG [Gimesia panareensis]